jgi:hypothetical protein
MRNKCSVLYKSKKVKKLEREMVDKEMAYRIKKGDIPNRKKSIKAFKFIKDRTLFLIKTVKNQC